MPEKQRMLSLLFLEGAIGLSSIALGDPYIASVEFESEVTALDEPAVVVTTGLGVQSVYIDWTQDDTRVRLSLNGGPSSSRWEGTLPANHAGIARFVACAEDESGNTARYLERSYLILENTSSPAGLSNMRYPSMKKWGVSGTTLDADWYGANYTRNTNSTPQIITLKGPTIPDSAVVNSSGTVQNGTGMIRSDKFADGVGSIWFKAKLSTTNSPTGNLRIVKLTTNNGTGARRRWFIHELASVDVPPASDFYEWHQFHLILQDIADIGDSSKCADGMAHYVIYNNTQNCSIDLQDIVLTPIIPDVKIYKDELDYAPAFPSVLDPIEFHIAASNVFAAASASNFTPRLHWRQGDRAPWNETLMTNVLGRTRQGDGGYACILFPGEEGFSDGPFEYFYTVDFTGYTPTFPAIKNNQSPLLNHVVNERFDGNEHPYLIHTNALALLTDADGNISECRSPAVCPTFADVFETTGADAFHDYATSDDVVPDTPATNGVWDLTRKFDLQNLDEGWPCATANRTVYHSYATTIEPDCVEIEGDYQYLTFCAKDGIRRFWSMYTGLTAVTEDHPDAAAPSNLEPAYPMQLVGDYTWQAIVRVTNAIDVVFSATGLNTDGAPVVWMEVDQPADAIQPPTSGILSINPGPDGVLGTRIQADYDGFLMFRFCTTNGAYQIRRAAWQDFNEWQSDDAWYSHSFGLDGVRTFEADLAGMATTAFAANLETRAFDELAAQSVPSFYPGGATPEWDEFDTQSLSGDEGPALAGSNARFLRERLPSDSEDPTSTNRNGALLLRDNPGQEGEADSTEVFGNDGGNTLAMKLRCYTDDDRNVVYRGPADTITGAYSATDWSNYRVMARIMQPSTNDVSEAEHSLSLIGYWQDPHNYWEARIIQKHEPMNDPTGRTRNWFEVRLFQWIDGDCVEKFGTVRSCNLGGSDNYLASNEKRPTWPGWNDLGNTGERNANGYWNGGDDCDFGLFTLDRKSVDKEVRWCFVFDLKTDGTTVTPAVWAFQSHDIESGACDTATLPKMIDGTWWNGRFFCYQFGAIDCSSSKATTHGCPGFNMRDCGLKIAPYVFGLDEAVKLDASTASDCGAVATAGQLSWYHSNDAAYDRQHKVDVWQVSPGGNPSLFPTIVTRPAPKVYYCVEQKSGGNGAWDDEWDFSQGHRYDGISVIASWKWQNVEIPMNLLDDTFLRIRALSDNGAGDPSCGSLVVINHDHTAVLRVHSLQPGKVETTDVSGSAGRGTLSMRVRSHTDDDRNIVYASGDSDTWSNYRVMARIMEPSTDQVSDGEHSLSLIGYWKDPSNYWEARIIQKSELMADQKGRTRNWFEVHLYQWRDGERIEYFGRIRANYYGGDSNYNASNARYPTWPGWNSTNNVGNVNQRGYWRQGQDSDYGLFTLDRNGQWCFVFDLKTEGDAVTPMVWAFRSNDIKDGRCEYCTLENAVNNSQSGNYFLYMFSPISSWNGASTSGRPGFNMRDCGLKIAPYVFGVGESVRLDGSMNGAFRGVSTADSSSWYHSNDAAYDSNHKIDVWTMTSGNYNLATNPTTLTRPAPTVFYRVDADRTGCEDAEAGRVADWDESWDSIHGHAGHDVRSVSSWKWEDVEIPMNLWDDTFLRIRALPDDGAGNPSCGSLAVDSLSCDDWRGKTIRIPENADEETGWTANYAAIVPDGRTGRKLELDRSRANPEPARPIDKQGVISPWMANGIGDVSFSYTLAKAPVRIVVGTVDAAGAFASRWAGMLEPTDEEDSFYAFLGTNIAGRVCVLVEDENDASRTNGRLGTLYITDLRATDYPRPDSTAWEGYNILVSSFSSNPDLLPDKFDGTSDAARSKRSAVLNDGWSNGTLDDQTFDEHVPFLSSPSIPTGLGEVSFWYRASPDNGGAPARIRLLVSVAGWMSDDTWRELTEDDLAWDRERYDKASDDPEYQAQRLALQSLSSISTTEWTFFRVQFSVPGACSLRIAGSAEGGTNRVMIDNVLVTEPDPLPVASSAALYSSSEYGTCFPIDGMSVFETGSLIEAIVLPPEPEAGMRPVCIGWKGSGSVPVAGTGTNVAFRIERNSAIAWQWRRDFRISVGVSGFGSCDFASGWIPEGDCVTATIVPSTEPCNILLSGDTNGVMLAGTTLTIPSDRPREIGVVVEAVNRLLDVSTAHGTPTPAAGTTTWSWGDSVTAGVTADAPVDGIRYVCTGWTGTGSVPASGTGANVTFTIEEDSSLTWNWRKENQIAVSVAGCGSCDFGTQWIEDGTTVTATIAPTTHLYAISMSGDTNGVTLSGTTLTIPGDGPRNIAVAVTETKLALDVATAHGTATPAAGTTTWSWGDSVTAGVTADAPVDGIRYVCTGWAGTGSVPASGTGANVTFTIEEDSSLAWNWRKENQIAVSVAGCGSCDFGTQWIEDGTTVTATIAPTTHLYAISMSGDTNGVTLSGTTLTIPGDGPRNIAVAVTETKLALDVTTAHGTATPAAGTAEWSWGDSVTASVAEPEPAGGWDFDCIGWAGTGSAPETGTATNVTFQIEEDSSIVWQWATNVWIDCSATGFASIAFAPCWTNFGETIVIPFEPEDVGFSWTLSGDTDSVVVDAQARTIAFSADRPRTIRIAFSGTARADAAGGGGKPVEWTHGGDAEWFVDFVDENDESGFLRSGEIGTSGNSWTEIAVTGPGRLDFDWRVSCNSRGHYAQVLVDETQWKRITGTTVWTTETIEIGEGEHRIRWNYVKGTTSPSGEDRACLDNVAWRPYVTLAVASEIDRCEPAVGEHRLLWGDEIAVSAEPAIVHTNERVVCTGWIGTGSAPTNGTTATATFAITENSTLRWNWGREIWVELATEGPVQVSFSNGWTSQGASNAVVVEATVDYVSWSMRVEDLETSDVYGLGVVPEWVNGLNVASPDEEPSVLVDTNSVHAVRFDAEAGRLTFRSHTGCRITLVAEEMTLATALDTHGLVWISEGDGKWSPQLAVSSDDEDAAKSGAVWGDDASVLRTTVAGPGTLSWTWRLDMEGSAGVDVFLDNAPVEGLYDACDWTDHALKISGTGEHEVRFEFWNAGAAETVTDCAYLDQMKWNGGLFDGATETTPVPVPYEWLNGYPELLDLFLHDYEATAWSEASNGENEVWQCYVAGLDPTNATARLLATIEMVDGSPIVSWTPDLNEGGTKHERVYTVEGKETLSDGWGPTNESARFFRVKVEMP